MKIALVHDWLYTYAGAEKVLEQILLCFPDADIYSLIDFLSEKERQFLGGRSVTTSFIQKLPFARTRHRSYLPLMPLAIEQFDLSSYDVIISSSHAVAKGVLTGPEQLHVCYCHSPIRYAWDLQHQYLQEAGLTSGFKSWLARYILHRIRLWDYRTINGVDEFIANSQFIARRIMKIYRRDATVIHPGVDISKFSYAEKKQEYYLAASRLVPYKKIGLIAEAFKMMPDKKLIIIGDGPERKRLEATIKNSNNIIYLGYQDDNSLGEYLKNAKAFIFAAEEDFGILPVEAQACGTPVIAYGKGGSRETVRDINLPDPTGIFFKKQTVSAICQAVDEFEKNQDIIVPENCLKHARSFSNEAFRKEFSQFVKDKYSWFKNINNLRH